MKKNFLPISILLAAVIISAAILFSGASQGVQKNLAQAGSDRPGGSEHQIRVAISDSDPMIGNPKAPVTMVAFEDFECPFCGRFSSETLPILAQREIKEGKVRLVWKDFPLSIHANSQKAHEAARCAWEQSKFWEYHDVLFSNQRNLGVNDLIKYAKNIGLDETKFSNCFDSGKYTALIQKKVTEGNAVGVSGTPSFVINGRVVVGAQPYQTFADLIAQEAQ